LVLIRTGDSAGHTCAEAEAPQWSRSPLRTAGTSFAKVIGESIPHVVEQQVRIGLNRLFTKLTEGMEGTRDKGRAMAVDTSNRGKHILATQDFSVAKVSSCTNAKQRNVLTQVLKVRVRQLGAFRVPTTKLLRATVGLGH
jgi:hypothetical protein